MQPDEAARRRSAEPRDMRRAMDGEIAVVEDRIWHRRIVVEGRAVVARERLRAEGPARRAIDPGGDRPGIAVLAVDDHGHPLARLVDADHDSARALPADDSNDITTAKPATPARRPMASSSPRSAIKARASDARCTTKANARLPSTFGLDADKP